MSERQEIKVKCGHVTVPLVVVKHLAELLDSGQFQDVSPKRTSQILLGLTARIEQMDAELRVSALSGVRNPEAIPKLISEARVMSLAHTVVGETCHCIICTAFRELELEKP